MITAETINCLIRWLRLVFGSGVGLDYFDEVGAGEPGYKMG